MILDGYNVDPGLLRNRKYLITALEEAASSSRLHVVRTGVKRFPNGALTAFLILSESHMSVHTWPEKGYAAFDVFTCDSRHIAAAERTLRRMFPEAHWEVVRVQRGRGL
jgi:S-adenosylmethionine decarboxylase